MRWFEWMLLGALGYNLFFLLFYVYDWHINHMRDERAVRGLVVFSVWSLVCILSFLLTRYMVSQTQ